MPASARNVVFRRRRLRRVVKNETDATRQRMRERPRRGDERGQQGQRRPGRIEGRMVRGQRVSGGCAPTRAEWRSQGSRPGEPAALGSRVRSFLIPRATEKFWRLYSKEGCEQRELSEGQSRGHVESKSSGAESRADIQSPGRVKCLRALGVLGKQQPLATSWWPSGHSAQTSLLMECGDRFTSRPRCLSAQQ